MKIKPKNAVTELKVWDSENSFYYVIKDADGREMILNRGSEYLEFKIAQQEFKSRKSIKK